MVGIISVVIGGQIGGGDHFDGGDHFGGGTGLHVGLCILCVKMRTFLCGESTVAA